MDREWWRWRQLRRWGSWFSEGALVSPGGSGPLGVKEDEPDLGMVTRGRRDRPAPSAPFVAHSTCFLMGPFKQLKKMFETTRLLATVVMLVSEGGGAKLPWRVGCFVTMARLSASRRQLLLLHVVVASSG